MSRFFAILLIYILIALPILLLIIGVRFLLKKRIKKWLLTFGIFVFAIIPITVLGILTSPTTWCKHQYKVVEKFLPTCIQEGTVKSKCVHCGKVITEYSALVPHKWKVAGVSAPTCTQDGYTSEKCEICHGSQKVNVQNALGHSMKEIFKVNPTPSTDGKIIFCCDRCEQRETDILPKFENEDNNKSKEHIQGKKFSFQFEGSTALSFMKKFCNKPGHIYIASVFRGTPNDLSYLEVLQAHSDSSEISWGKYYTVTATVALADYNHDKTRINCRVESNNIVVVFSVEFREEFDDIIDLYKEGDVITFKGKFYDEGCGFKDAVVISELTDVLQ